jgi:hypothetical protein
LACSDTDSRATKKKANVSMLVNLPTRNAL